MIQTRHVYCPSCRKQVRIAVTPAAGHGDGHANIPDSRHVCLDFEAGCECPAPGSAAPASALCPLFGVPATVMGLERARAGLSPEPRPLVRSLCGGCGAETTQERVGLAHTVCEICGSPNSL